MKPKQKGAKKKIFRLRNRTVPSVSSNNQTQHRIEPRFVGQVNQRERLSPTFIVPS